MEISTSSLVSQLYSSSSTSSTSNDSTINEDMEAQLFNNIDSDSDGSISETEFAAFQEFMAQKMSSMDSSSSDSSDDSVSATESTSSTSELFAELDTDGDGALSSDELLAMKGSGGAGAPPPPPPPSGTSEDDETTTDFIEELMAAIAEQTDTDTDGIISDTEGDSLLSRLQSMLDNSSYTSVGSTSLGDTSGSILDYLS